MTGVGGGVKKRGRGEGRHEEMKTRRPSRWFASFPFPSPSAVDRHRFDADPDPTFPFNGDPDLDSYPDPGSYPKCYNVGKFTSLPYIVVFFSSASLVPEFFNILDNIGT
jgi:hypothetical protein